MSDIVTRAILKDEMSAQLEKIKSEFKKTSQGIDKTNKKTKKLGDSMGLLGGQAKVLKGAFALMSGTVAGVFVKSLISASSEMETLETKFKVLLGDTESAKARMQELSKFASTTPFQLNEIANASRVLQTLGGTALATGDSLRMVGDASAISGESFENLAIHIGRAYSGLKANRPIGESLARLQELGLVSGETRNQIEDLTKQAKGTEAWKVLQTELKKSEGGMKALSKTFGGLASTLKDQFAEALRQISKGGFFDDIKSGLSSVVKTMADWLNSGVFQRIGAGWDYLKYGFKGVSQTVLLGFQRIGEASIKMIAEMLGGLNNLLNALPSAIVPDSWTENIGHFAKTMDLMYKDVQNGADDMQINALGNLDKMKGAWDIFVGNVAVRVEKFKETEKEATQVTKTETEKQAEIKVEKTKEVADAVAKIDEDALRKKEENEKYYTDLLKREADHRKAIRMGELNLAMALTSSLSTISRNALGSSKKDAKTRKTIALGEAIINTGLGVTKALASSPPPLNFINAGIVGSQGAAQISTIASQKFAQGGIVKSETGVPNIGDKTLVRVNAGEGVFTQDQMKALGGMMGTNNISPTLVVNGNVDSSTVPKLNDSLQSFADKIISAIRGNELDLVNELNLVTQ